MTTINHLLNGLGAALLEREDLIIKAVAEANGLQLEEVRRVAEEACGKQKQKAIKPQKRQAKKAGAKKARAPSAYQLFAKLQRETAKRLLMDFEEERTFVDSKGETKIVSEADFTGKDGGPRFGHITQKVASMWHALEDADKEVYKEMAKDQGEEEAPPPAEPVVAQPPSPTPKRTTRRRA